MKASYRMTPSQLPHWLALCGSSFTLWASASSSVKRVLSALTDCSAGLPARWSTHVRQQPPSVGRGRSTPSSMYSMWFERADPTSGHALDKWPSPANQNKPYCWPLVQAKPRDKPGPTKAANIRSHPRDSCKRWALNPVLLNLHLAQDFSLLWTNKFFLI